MRRIKKQLGNKGKKIKDSSLHQTISSSTNNDHIVFSFQHLDSTYCITKCEKQDQIAFVNQLKILGSKTWQELTGAPRHGIGYEKIDDNAIKVPPPRSLRNHERLTYIAFRFSGTKPMIGYRDQQIFHIIWIDHNFSVYHHG